MDLGFQRDLALEYQRNPENVKTASVKLILSHIERWLVYTNLGASPECLLICVNMGANTECWIVYENIGSSLEAE